MDIYIKNIYILVSIFLLFGCVKENLVKNNLYKTVKVVTFSELVDTMDVTDGWVIYSDEGVEVDLNSVSGKSNSALEISFDFVSGNWFAITKVFNKNFSKFRALRFEYLGTGDKNSLEVKLEDEDSSNYGYIIPKKTNFGSWQVIEIPFTEFEYWWGGDEKFNWKKVKSVHFAVTKRKDDVGGKGRVVIDNLELIK